MTSVFVAEFLGAPVETNIVDTAKGRENEMKIECNSHQYVAVGLDKKSGSSNDKRSVNLRGKFWCLPFL